VNDSGEVSKRSSVAEAGRDWLDRVLAHDASAEDEAAMLEWSGRSPEHARALAAAVQLRGRMLDVRDVLRSDPETAGMLATARASLQQSRPRAPLGRRAFLGTLVSGSAAAGVMLMYPPLGLWPSLAELRADYRTGVGERRTVEIASGLAVELNTHTALARRDDAQAYRLGLISGEVAVDARRLMRPVVIETGYGEASTSDGRFSARLQDAGMCVTCLAGEVAVQAPGRPAARLQRGQQTILGQAAAPSIVAVDPNVASAWQRGELIFNDRPLTEVIAEINRYRPGRIVLTNAELGSRTVNAVFRVDRLDSAPAQIRNVAGASVTSLPGGIVLLS
jgi:transmembrane sensor